MTWKIVTSVSVSRVSQMLQTLQPSNSLHLYRQDWPLFSHQFGQGSTAQKFNNPSHFSFDKYKHNFKWGNANWIFQEKKREVLCNASEFSGKSLEIANLNEFSSSRNEEGVEWKANEQNRPLDFLELAENSNQIKGTVRHLRNMGGNVGKCHGVPRDAMRSGNQSAHVSGSTACNRPGAMTNVLKDWWKLDLRPGGGQTRVISFKERWNENV